jgi:O-antigen/teichoic acid export membrane protein
MRVLLALGLFGIAVVLYATGLVPSGSGELLVVFSLTLFPLAFILEWVFEAVQSVGVVGLARVIKGALFLVLVVVFVHDAGEAVDSAFYYVVSFSIASGFVAVAANRRFGLFPPSLDIAGARNIFREALPIGTATVLSQYSFFIGTILLGYMASGAELGWYNAAHRLVTFIWAYGIVTSSRVLLPQLSRSFGASTEEFADLVMGVLRMITAGSLLFGIIAVAGGSGIIRLIFGDQYAQSGPVLQILSLGLVIGTTRSVLETGLVASRRPQLYMKGMIGLAVLYSVFTYVGIRSYGILGAAAASLVVEIVYAVYLMIVFEVVPFRRIVTVCWKPYAAAVVAGLLLLLTGVESLPLVVMVGGLSYGALLFATGQISSRDFRNLRNVIGSVPDSA